MSKATRTREPFAYSLAAVGTTWSLTLAAAATLARSCFLELARPIAMDEMTLGWSGHLDESAHARLGFYTSAIDASGRCAFFASLAGTLFFWLWLTRVRALASRLWPRFVRIPRSLTLVGAYFVPVVQAWWPFRHLQLFFSLSDPAAVRLFEQGTGSYRSTGIAEVPAKHTEGITWILLMWVAFIGHAGAVVTSAALRADPWTELAREHEPFYLAAGLAVVGIKLLLLVSAIRTVRAISSRQLEQLERARKGGQTPRALAEAERARSPKRAKKRKAPTDPLAVELAQANQAP